MNEVSPKSVQLSGRTSEWLKAFLLKTGSCQQAGARFHTCFMLS